MNLNPPLPAHLVDLAPDIDVQSRDQIPPADFLVYLTAYPGAEFVQAMTDPVEGWWGVKVWLKG